MKDPKIIYLQKEETDCGRTWCQDRIEENDTAYICFGAITDLIKQWRERAGHYKDLVHIYKEGRSLAFYHCADELEELLQNYSKQEKGIK